MGLYRLKYNREDLSDGVMEKANREPIDYEKDFENWLENSPHVLFEEEAATIMWIGRQVTATYDSYSKYPDLMGIDSEGNVVIVELKKGRTPRDVVAQILEYAAWANQLTYEELNILTIRYYDQREEYLGMELRDIHRTIYHPDLDGEYDLYFNIRLRLYIVAEDITPTVRNVVKYLNESGNIDISCMKYDVYKDGNGEFYISTEMEESEVSNSRSKSIKSNGWNGNTPVKNVVRDAVDIILTRKTEGTFTGKEVLDQVRKLYPNCNVTSVSCQLYSDCVNHTSRKHYQGGQMDYYYTIGRSLYRLYNASRDGRWNGNGEKIEG